MLSARHRIICVESYGKKKLDSADKVVVDVRPPKKMKKRRELDALANSKKHATANSASARPTDRRSLVVPDDSSSSDVFVSTERDPCQLITSRYCRRVVLIIYTTGHLKNIHLHSCKHKTVKPKNGANFRSAI